MLALRKTEYEYPVLLTEHWGLGGREATRRRRRRYPMLAALTIAALAVLPFVAYVAAASNAARIGYRMLQETQDIAALQTDHERLQAIASSLRAPDRIARLAASLGLVPPGPGQIAALTLPPREPVRADRSAPGLWQRLGEYFHRNEAAAAPLSR